MSTVKIYKITSSFTDKVYIGQTRRTLGERFSEHKQQCKNDKNNCTSKELLKFGDAKMELLEECPLETRLSRELHYITHYGDLAVNKVKPTRTKKEYKEDNREAIRAKTNEWREANREKINAKRREYLEANKEVLNARQRDYYKNNKDEINAKTKEWRDANREAVNTRQRDYWQKNKEVINAKRRFQNTEFGSLCKGLANYF